MSDSAEPSITCPVCGTKYRWIEDLAGYKIKCKCSAVLRVPEKAAEVPTVLEQGAAAKAAEGYDIDVPANDDARTPEPKAREFVRTGKCPSCGLAVKYGTVICINCGFNIAEGTRLQTQLAATDSTEAAAAAVAPASAAVGAKFSHMAEKVLREKERVAKERASAERTHRLKETTIPIIFMIAGLIAVLGGGALLAHNMLMGLAISGVLVLIEICIMLPLLLVAIYIAANIGGIGFGSLFTAILKLAAICCGPGAIGDVIMLVVAALFGMSIYIMVAAVTVIYTICLGLPMMYLFDLDAQDMRMTVGVAVVIRILAFILGYSLLAGLIS